MKKTAATLTIVLVLLILSNTALKANNSVQISELMASISSELVIEKDIKLEQWMYSPFATERTAPEAKLSIENWMLDAGSWNGGTVAGEPELQVQDWMIRSFEIDNRIVLENWMSRISD